MSPGPKFYPARPPFQGGERGPAGSDPKGLSTAGARPLVPVRLYTIVKRLTGEIPLTRAAGREGAVNGDGCGSAVASAALAGAVRWACDGCRLDAPHHKWTPD